MPLEELQKELEGRKLAFRSFLDWFGGEFTIWQNVGAFDRTELGYNAKGDIVYAQMYATVEDYIEDTAFDRSVLELHLQDWLEGTGYVDQPKYSRYLEFDREVVDDPIPLDALGKLFPHKREGAEALLKLRARAVEKWIDTQTWLAGQDAKAQELLGNSGKNNLGVFAVEIGGKDYFVKVVLEHAGAQFERLQELNRGLGALQEIDDLPGFARILDWGATGGVALGLFEQAEGRALEDLHEDWSRGRLSEEALTEVYGSVGSGLGAFHLGGVTGEGSKSKRRKAPARSHGDPNPSNLFIGPAPAYRPTLIDNEGVNLEAELTSISFDLGALLMSFKRETFARAGESRRKEIEEGRRGAELTEAETRARSELRAFFAFALRYLGKADASIREFVLEDLKKQKKVYVEEYLRGAGLDLEEAAERLPELAFRFE